MRLDGPTMCALLAALANSGCNWAPPPSEAVSAPFEARLGALDIRVPKAADLTRATLLRRYGVAETAQVWICADALADRPITEHCAALLGLRVSAPQGTQVMLHAPRHLTRYTLIKERPGGDVPPTRPLEPVPVTPAITRVLPNGGGGEGYPLSRLQLFGKEDYVTTVRKWPIAVCARHPAGRERLCHIGFRIKDVFVESTAWFDRPEDIDQRQLWLVATAIDAELRARIVQDAGPTTRN